MRILQVGKYYPPVLGGIEQHFHLLCRGVAAKHQVTALVFNTSRRAVRETIEGVDVQRTGTFGKVLSTEIAPSFVARLRRLPADLIHLHAPNPLGELGVALRKRGGSLIVTHHSDVVRQRSLRLLYDPLVNAVYRRADRIIVTTRRYMETSETLAPYRAKCAIIPLGLDLTEYDPTPALEARAAEIRRRHGSRIVLFVGRHVYYKGVDVLLRAMRGVDAAILVVGDGPMRARWEQAARDEGIAPRTFFTGEVPHEEKVAHYRACDLFVLPATHRSEAFGLVQVEAQACARPIVSTNVDSGVPFVNQDGVTGLVVPPSDPDALGRAIAAILADAEMGRRMGEAGRRRAEAEFSLPAMLRRTLDLYDEVRRERNLS